MQTIVALVVTLLTATTGSAQPSRVGFASAMSAPSAITAYGAAVKKFGVKLVSTEFVDRGQADYRPLLSKIKRANPEAVLLVMLASDASVFLRQYREVGLKQRLFARGSVATVEFLVLAKD